jgi:hypothetical protein
MASVMHHRCNRIEGVNQWGACILLLTWERFGWPTELCLQSGLCMEVDQKKIGNRECKIR